MPKSRSLPTTLLKSTPSTRLWLAWPQSQRVALKLALLQPKSLCRKSASPASKSFSAAYHEAFWARFKNRSFQNTTNLNEGSNANGDYLVPVTVDGTIVPLAPLESAMRKLALVIPTSMDIKLPAQLTKTIAASKSESTTIDQAFGGTAPTFTQVTLGSHMAGAVVPVSFELAQDVPALQAFLNADILRGIQNYEETKFISGSGSGEPQGILNGASAFETAALSINAVLDLTGALPAAYYDNASFLMHRKTGIALKKVQLAASQFQTFWTSVGSQDFSWATRSFTARRCLCTPRLLQ